MTKDAGKNMTSKPVLFTYITFGSSALAVHHFMANGEFSSILTMAVMLQCLAFALLVVQVLSAGSCAGVSARTLVLDGVALGCRLSSTTWLNGYLPVDASGDWAFQAADVLSMIMVMWLLHHVLVSKRHTYQADADSLPVVPCMLSALMLATVLHADMNSRPLFDTLWMTGLFISAVAVLPQLWMITRTGGRVEALTSHYIAVMAFSRILSGTFMWHARHDISCSQWISGFNHATWAILAAHCLQLLLLVDFGYYYVKAVASQGLACRLELGQELDV